MNDTTFFSTDPLIGAHLNHYRQTLNLGKPVFLSQFVDTYLQMKPLLHSLAGSNDFDLPAFRYAVTRLPESTYKIKKIFIGQNISDLEKYAVKTSRQYLVGTPNRRRIMYYDDSNQVLGCLINSDSDIDDLINLLLIYLIEIRKIKINLNNIEENKELPALFSSQWSELLAYLSANNFDPEIQLLPLNQAAFTANCHLWWQNQISSSLYLNLNQTPVYFVSSNSHSLVNIVGGFINQKQNYLFDYIAHHHPDIYTQWFNSKTEHNRYQNNDFLYYLSNVFLKNKPEYFQEKLLYEKSLGVVEINNLGNFPINIQIIPIKAMALSPALDSNLKIKDRQKLLANPAVIVNVEYPLGIAAKYLLEEIINYFFNLKGVYIIGKAAILNGTTGDIQIPEIVSDEISNNIIKFPNIFNQFFPYTANVSHVFSHQKAVCVYGTLLENQNQINNYLQTGFNIIEMELSHYLSVLVQHFLLKNQPLSRGTYYHLDQLPVDLGVIYYASDNPLTKNLGHETIEFQNIETTYLPSLTILQRIIDLETS